MQAFGEEFLKMQDAGYWMQDLRSGIRLVCQYLVSCIWHLVSSPHFFLK